MKLFMKDPEKATWLSKGKVLERVCKLKIEIITFMETRDNHEYNHNNYAWVWNPFGNCETKELTTKKEEQLIELKEDIIHKTNFSQTELSFFWIVLISHYEELSLKAVKTRVFSFVRNKIKKRERLLMIDQEIRVFLSTIEPRIEKICEEKQCHTSHWNSKINSLLIIK